MSDLRLLKWLWIIILSFIVTFTISASDAEDFKNIEQYKEISEDDLHKLIWDSLTTNINISPVSDPVFLDYYTYYFIINRPIHNLYSLLKITEIAIDQDEPDIIDNGLMIVTIKLNHEDIDPIVSIFKREEDILFPLKELIAFDVNQEYLSQFGKTEQIENETYISLKSLPGSRYLLDDELQNLKLNFPSSVMKEQHFDANTYSKESEFSKAANGAYLNYDITLTNTQNRRSMTGVQELNFFTEKGSGTYSTLIRKRLSGPKKGAFVKRLETYWTTENEEDLTSWNYGDGITYSAPWSSSTRFGGVQYSSNYAIKPSIVIHPLINFNGAVESPTDINVYANTQQIYSNQAKTGNFDIDNLPITTGRGDLIVKLKDITGKIQTIVVPYYVTPELLKPGLTEYSYSVGKQRHFFGIENNKYQNIVTSFDCMRGIDDNWTTGGHFESLDNVFSTGVTSVNKLGLYGVVQTSAANSHFNNFNAQRVKAEYSYQGLISFFTGITIDRNGFPDIFANKQNYSKSKGLSKSFQCSVGYGDNKFGSAFISISSTKNYNKDSPSRIDLINGSYSKELNKDSTIRFNLGTNLNPKRRYKDLYMTFSYAVNLGNKSISTNLSRRTADKELSKGIGISSNSNGQSDLSYSADFNKSGKHTYYDINLTKPTEIMEASFYFFDFDKNRTEQVSFMGSVTEIDRSIHFARTIDNSLALVKTSNFKDVPIYVNNHVIGNTNSKGQILVPNLIPYTPSEIKMDINKIPLDSKLTYQMLFATPHWKSGTILNFEILRQRSLKMVLIDSSNNPLEVNRSVKIDGIADETYIGYDGLIYIEDIKQLNDITGTSCDDGNRCCSFNIPLNIPENYEIIDLGKEICK